MAGKRRSKMAALASLTCAGLIVFGVACSGNNTHSTPAPTPTIPAPTVVPTLTQPPTNGQSNDRDEFVDTVKAQLEQIQTRTDEIRKEMANLSEDERASAEQRLSRINDNLAEIQSSLKRVPAASGGEYDSLRAEIEDRINQTMNDAQELADGLGI